MFSNQKNPHYGGIAREKPSFGQKNYLIKKSLPLSGKGFFEKIYSS
jgi:hypothetical protein